MSFTEREAIELIKSLESQAKLAPHQYELRVILLGLLGYAYVAAVLLGLLLILYWLGLAVAAGTRMGYVIGKIGWLVIGLGIIILRALWVKFPHPTGVKLSAAQSPQLFRAIDDLTIKMQAPRPHEVLLTNDFNAAVVQIPRLSFFGWPKTYLILGLPLMAKLTTQQFTAVVAHELGHISGQHGGFLAWIYRIRVTWFQLMSLLENQQHIGTHAFRKFVDWYAPYFNAYSFVLARQHELQADRSAAAATSGKATAEALTAVAILGQGLEQKYWPAVYRQAEDQPAPIAQPYLKLVNEETNWISHDDSKTLMRAALTTDTGYADTHPCLRERLDALGQPATATADGEPPAVDLFARPEPSAAAELLGPTHMDYAKQFDKEWQEAIGPAWKERFDETQTAKARLQELTEQARQQTLSTDLAWERIALTLRLETADAALPLTQELMQFAPDHPSANYLLGQLLTDQGHSEGVACLKKAMAHDRDLTIAACLQLFKYYSESGNASEAQTFLNKAEERQGILALAQQERQSISRADEFSRHHLSAAELQTIIDQLKRYGKVRRAFLARKVLQLLPEKPLYVLAIEPKVTWLGLIKQKDNQILANQLATEVTFPGETYIYVCRATGDWLKATLRRLDGAQVYDA